MPRYIPEADIKKEFKNINGLEIRWKDLSKGEATIIYRDDTTEEVEVSVVRFSEQIYRLTPSIPLHKFATTSGEVIMEFCEKKLREQGIRLHGVLTKEHDTLYIQVDKSTERGGR